MRRHSYSYIVLDRIAIDLISQHIVDHLSIPGPPTPEVQVQAITQTLADSRKRFVLITGKVEQSSNDILFQAFL